MKYLTNTSYLILYSSYTWDMITHDVSLLIVAEYNDPEQSASVAYKLAKKAYKKYAKNKDIKFQSKTYQAGPKKGQKTFYIEQQTGSHKTYYKTYSTETIEDILFNVARQYDLTPNILASYNKLIEIEDPF